MCAVEALVAGFVFAIPSIALLVWAFKGDKDE